MSPSVWNLFLVLGLWIGLTMFCCAGSGGRSTSVYPPGSISVSAGTLIQEYEDNEVAADGTYRGKRLAVTGKIESIGKDILDNPYVTLSSDGNISFPSVQCMFDDKAIGVLSSLRKGMSITLEGTCDGKLGNVLLKDCSLR
jgi:hypothetical protein